MNPTIQTFLRALQTPDTSMRSLTAARAATDAAGLPRLQRSTRFAEAEIAWRNGQWLLSMPLTSAALPRIERTVSRLRRLNTPWAGEYRILPGELRWEDAAGTARSTDLVMEALPAGCPFEGLACVEDEAGFGYVDADNRPVIAAQYLWAGDFHEGRAEVETPTGMGLIDRRGGYVIPPRYEIVEYDPATSVSRVRQNGRWALFDYLGRRLTPFGPLPDEE